MNSAFKRKKPEEKIFSQKKVMEEKLRHFSAKKCQFGHEIQPLIFDVNIQHIGPYRLSRPWPNHGRRQRCTFAGGWGKFIPPSSEIASKMASKYRFFLFSYTWPNISKAQNFQNIHLWEKKIWNRVSIINSHKISENGRILRLSLSNCLILTDSGS